jgi:CheY-like chemotaxis protein
VVQKNGNNSSKFLKILIAEDINSNYLLLKSILKNDNYHLFRAYTGKEAVDFFKKDNFNIVLMDIKMPVMDGLEATKQIKEINSKVPIIAVTAYALENEKEKAIAAGCDDIITKPIDKDDLINKINSYLH